MLKEKCNTKCNGYLILLIVELLFLLMLLPGCFQEEKRMLLLGREDIAEQAADTTDYLQFTSESMELTPGVYRIEVKAQLGEGQSILVETLCEDSYFRALRGNAVTIYPGEACEDFNVYVVDKIPAAYLQFLFEGTDINALEQITVSKTNFGNRMLLFLATVLFLVLDFFVILRQQILEGKVTRRQQIVFWTLAAGVLLAYFPYLTDYFSIGTDTAFHMERITHLKETLRQGGTFPVRVQSTWLCDHGYATSMFYGELFLYIPACIMLLGFSVMNAYKILVFLMTCATAAVAYFSFKKCVKDEYAALFGSMVYLLAPFRIYNVYNRGGVGECLAMIFLPLICCGMYLLYTEDVTAKDYTKNKWYVIWGISGVLQSHLLTTEMVVVFMAIFCVLYWKKTLRRQTFVQLSQATGIALLINAWFWVPFVQMMSSDVYNLEGLELAEVQSRGLFLSNLLQLLPNQGNSQTGWEPVHIGVGSVILLVAFWIWSIAKREANRICSVLAGFSVVTLIMCTRYIPWDAIRKLPGIGFVVSSLQYPARWMVLSTVFAALFAACFFVRIVKENNLYLKIIVGIAAVVIVGSAVYHVNNIIFEARPVYLYAAENLGTTSVGNGEYLLAGTQVEELKYHNPVAEEGLEWSAYEKKGTNVSLLLQNTTNETRYIEIPLTGYKGYTVEAGGEAAEMPHITEERGSHGDLKLSVPAGYQGMIHISYKGFGLFHIAEAVSLITLIVLSGMHLYQRRKRVQNGK